MTRTELIQDLERDAPSLLKGANLQQSERFHKWLGALKVTEAAKINEAIELERLKATGFFKPRGRRYRLRWAH